MKSIDKREAEVLVLKILKKKFWGNKLKSYQKGDNYLIWLLNFQSEE